MPIIELVPQTELAFNATFWSVVGAANSVIALNDEDNASYIQATSVLPLTAARWDLSSAGLAADQRVSAIRMRLGVLQSSGVMTFKIYEGATSNYRVIRTIGNGPVCGGLNPNDCSAPGSAIFYSEWWSGGPTLPLTANEITQSVLDGLQFSIEMVSPDGGTLQYASMLLEVDVRSKPTVTVNPAFGSPVSTLVSWTPTMNDGDVQSAYEIAIFSEAQYTAGGFNPTSSLATFRAVGTGTTTSAPVAVSLVEGVNYRAYVRVAKKLFYGTTAYVTPAQQASTSWYSDWSFGVVIVSPVATANYIGPVSEGSLGCHDWVVALQERGGGRIIAEIPWASFTWGRVLEDASQATVTFPYSYCTTNRDLAAARPWTHEIGVWRDTKNGWNEEWVGPIVGRSKSRKSVTWTAKDLFVWFEHRRVHSDYTLTAVDLSTIFNAFALDALGPDNSMGIVITARAAGITGDRTVIAAQRRRAADLLRDLARSGVSFTMIARTLLVAGLQLPLDALVRLIDEHTEDPQQSEDGSSAATDVALVGKLVDDVQTLGSATLDGSDLGVLETTVSSNEIEDSTLADMVAASNLSVLSVVPEQLTVPLSADSQNGYAALIPGASQLLDLPSIEVFGSYQLQSLQVSVSRQDASVKEDVKAVLQTPTTALEAV